MRILLACLVAAACSALAAADPAPLPPALQKQLDDSTTVVTKARMAYEQAARKEQDRLVAALTKEQDRESKKGNLDGALVVKDLIEQVQAGLLLRKAEEGLDLLGDGGGKAPAPGTTPAGLITDCAVGAAAARPEGTPKAIEAMMARASALAIPKGDKTRYAFTVLSAGTVAIMTGSSEHNHADLWPELLKAGFKRADDGANGAWFVLEAKAGSKFQAWDPPLAGAQVQIFAGKFKLAH